MSIEGIDIEKTIARARKALENDKNVSDSIRSTMELLLLVVTLLCKRLGLNSSNSSKPPSQDPNRLKKKRKQGKRKPGGQKGRAGKTLERVEDPDDIVNIKVDRRKLPRGRKYKVRGFQPRQIIDFETTVHVTEFRAEILEDETGKQYTADFPEGLTQAIQYGPHVKANAVYMNCYQMSSLSRIEDNFVDQLNMPVSKGSVHNFAQQAYDRLEGFEVWVRQRLVECPMLHADETGVNIDGKNHWLHVLCNDKYSLFHADEKRGKEATDRMGILPGYTGVLCHDHWKPYFRYTDCSHCLCNAHHIRELQSVEEGGQIWAKRMKKLLILLNDEVDKAGGTIDDATFKKYRKRYRSILTLGDRENPLPERKPGQRGRLKKSKPRNLLDRFRNFEVEVLLFTTNSQVAFTNNQAENDLRMTKVQQKVSGCFRSMNGAKIFARIRSYINTCRKHSVSPTQALIKLFKGELPDFVESC